MALTTEQAIELNQIQSLKKKPAMGLCQLCGREYGTDEHELLVYGDGTREQTRQQKQRIFLQSFRMTGTIGDSIKKADISTYTLYKWKEDAAFLSHFKDAEAEYLSTLERHAHKLAVEGVDEPVVSAGRLVTTKKVYSTRLLEVMLKRKDPAYRENSKIGAEIGTDGEGKRYIKVYQGFDPDEV